MARSVDGFIYCNLMNINVERLPECKATLQVELPADRVSTARAVIVTKVVSQAKLPGFRPGKIPKAVAEKRFSKQIKEQLEEELVNLGCREAIQEEKLDVLSVDKVEDESHGVDGTFKFVAHLTTKPSFELPEYKGMTVKVPVLEVKDEDIDRQIENLRERFADFNDVEGRPVAKGDVAVIDYKGSIDGKPVGEVLPQANAYIAQNHDYWMKVDEGVFLPGFTEQLEGMSADEDKSVTVTLAEDFPIEEARGVEVVYEVKVKGLKEQLLPEVDDELAEKIAPGQTLAELRVTIAERIKSEQAERVENYKVEQILGQLNGQMNFEVPPEMLKAETQSQVDQMVERGQKQGMEDQQIEAAQEEIFQQAEAQALNNVKTSFILQEIARIEEIKVEDNELLGRIQGMAEHYKTPIKKFVKQLQQNNQIGRVRESIMVRKVLEFLKEEASLEEFDPAEEAAKQAAGDA